MKKIWLSAAGALLIGCAAVLGLVALVHQAKTAKGQVTQLQATCTANPMYIVDGASEAVTYNVSASGGYGSCIYHWNYPTSLASCNNATSTIVAAKQSIATGPPQCTTVPISRGIQPGEFSVTVISGSNLSGISPATANVSCPAVPVVRPAAITATSTPTEIGPFGNKDGDHYCPAGTVAIGFGGGNGYQNVKLICAPLNAAGTAVLGSSAYSDATTYKIDSDADGGSAGCVAWQTIVGAEWAKNGQIDFGRCLGSNAFGNFYYENGGLVLGNTYTTGLVSSQSPAQCKQGYLPIGFTNYPGKNDAWGSLTCAQTFIPVPTGGGTITVTSEDSVLTSTLVDADWSQGGFVGSVADPCAVGSCTGTEQTYLNMPLGAYTLSSGAVTVTTTLSSFYVLHSIESAPVATQRPTAPLLALPFISEFFNTANAATDCGYMSGSLDTCTPSTDLFQYSLTLATAGQQANFIIFWDPVAAIGVSPSAVSLNAPAGSTTSTQVRLTNSGGQGSTLNWTAKSDKSWLSVWPNSGCLNAGGKAVPDCSDTNGYESLTLTANASSLAAGTYAGTVTFNGTSAPTTTAPAPAQQTLTVTLTVGPASPPPPPSNPPSCTFGASPQQIVPPEQSTLSWSCTNAATCTLSGGEFGSGQGEFTSGSTPVSPAANTTYTLSCDGFGSGSTNTVTTETTVTVQGPALREINP